MLDGVVGSVGQAAEGGDVGGVDEGGDQALQVAHSTLCHGVGLDCIIRILHRDPLSVPFAHSDSVQNFGLVSCDS